MLEGITTADLILNGISNYRSVKMLVNHCLCYFTTMMKEIRVIKFQFVFLKLIPNYYFILICHKINSFLASMKINSFIFCAFKFFH